VSPTRRLFLRAITLQLTGTRVLALVTLAVLLLGAGYWLFATSGSPVIAVYFVALAAVLTVAVYWFIQVMYLFTGRR
jgi:hypothetical protein